MVLEIYAAIDLLGGRSVRLVQGDFSRVTDYGDPLKGALRLTAHGPSWLHIVDLQAARTGMAHQREVVASLAGSVSVPVQVGGGIRSAADAQALLSIGISRVVFGTTAVTQPELVKELAGRYPGKIAVGLDHKGPPDWALATRGWEEESSTSLLQAARYFEQAGVASLIVTAIATDGTLKGPDLEGLSAVLGATDSVEVIASGGVGTVSDIEALASLRVGDRRLSGVIVGRAAQDGAVNLEEAARLCAQFG